MASATGDDVKQAKIPQAPSQSGSAFCKTYFWIRWCCFCTMAPPPQRELGARTLSNIFRRQTLRIHWAQFCDTSILTASEDAESSFIVTVLAAKLNEDDARDIVQGIIDAVDHLFTQYRLAAVIFAAPSMTKFSPSGLIVGSMVPLTIPQSGIAHVNN